VRAVGEMAVVRLVSDWCQLCVGCKMMSVTMHRQDRRWKLGCRLPASLGSPAAAVCRTTFDACCLITRAMLFVAGNWLFGHVTMTLFPSGGDALVCSMYVPPTVA
jgi:hypothetical protein